VVVVTPDQLRTLIAEAVKSASQPPPEQPVNVQELAKFYRTDPARVRLWVEQGCPHFRTGDVRGLRFWPDDVRR
jgi:hypothetical protein